ncbi:GyrI-like domain-containing protein [Planococcus sp. ISL-109]|uniref:GyrI-like domain-containing protein n=1 Tax=Planococcus sp. ISL-109 TaxID=2819166 RepID=UPI001BE70F6F|nr:GyrI-like domain-containing protein [Planococcus sp. ISL-109]MBT2581575.1 GyrI-like domain-containing protein [Planococcus sp. ISL-109]
MYYINEPIIEQRSYQPYVGIAARVSAGAEEASALAAEILDWLIQQKETPTGRPFIRYWCLEEDGRRLIEVGIPTKRLLSEDHRMVTGYLPGGAFVHAVHHGPPSELWESSLGLIDWIEREGLAAALRYEGETKIWDGHFAFFVTDPLEKKMSDAWTLELYILLLADHAA